MSDLKDYDDKIIHFIIFNIVVSFLLITSKTAINNEIIPISLLISILYLPIYLINNIIPREWKFFILYPKNNHRFSYGIFSKMKSGKLNYDKKLIELDLILKVHNMPKTEKEEDELWYKIYTEHRDTNKIRDQNRRFLLCRDYTMIILIITLIFPVFALFLRFVPVFALFLRFEDLILIMALIGIIEFIVFWYLARKNNEKLAKYVLEEETNNLKKG